MPYLGPSQADWEVDPKNPKKGLFGKPNQKGVPVTTFIGFADGSVRVIKEAIDPEMLQRVIDHHDGEVINRESGAFGN